MAVYFDPHPAPHAGALYANVLANLIGSVQDRNQQQSDSADKLQNLQDASQAKQFLTLPPDVQAKSYGTLSDNVKAYILNPAMLAAHTNTPAEDAQANYETFLKNQSTNFNTPMMADPSKLALFNKNAAEKPFMEYQGQRFNYGNQNVLPAGVTTAQQTADKVIPTGGEQLTVGEAARHNKVEESQTGPLRSAQTAEANAGVPLKNAQAAEAQAKTAGQLQQNNLAGTDTANIDVRTTVSGKQYADISGYTPKEKSQLKKAYESKGIPALDTKDIAALHDIDTARMNTQSIIQSIESKLPKDATGRVLGGALGNRLSQVFQTDSDLAAFNAYRAAAIRNLRAMAGSTGLRINQAEVTLAVENDIPKITDTVDTANAKMRNINTMLDNAESPVLSRAKPSGSNGTQSAQPKVGDTKTFPNGKVGKWDGQGWVAQ